MNGDLFPLFFIMKRRPRKSPPFPYTTLFRFVAVLPEFDAIVDQVVPPSVDLSILYPVIAEPPLSAGAVHVRPTWEEEGAVAVTPVGEDRAAIGVRADPEIKKETVPVELVAGT